MHSPTTKHIILGSNSPRRRELLGRIAPEFSIAPARYIDESYPPDMDVMEIAAYISRKKAIGYADLACNDNTVLITADTVVVVDEQILGKPRDEQEALNMLRGLSGRMHRVVTGVTLMSASKSETFSAVTEVYFDDIPDRDIREYIREYRPFDKAGSYGIQEWIGFRGVKGIKGCYYNVMGLPVNELYNHLRQI